VLLSEPEAPAAPNQDHTERRAAFFVLFAGRRKMPGNCSWGQRLIVTVSPGFSARLSANEIERLGQCGVSAGGKLSERESIWPTPAYCSDKHATAARSLRYTGERA
jgi:hypothetical protein